jgi:hypothetical protein
LNVIGRRGCDAAGIRLALAADDDRRRVRRRGAGGVASIGGSAPGP